MATHRTLLIIGSGPAGLTAALYASRNRLEPLVLAGSSPGGQLMTTTEVENYPGFVEGINGPELIQVMTDQAKRFGADFEQVDAESVDLSERPFTVRAGDETYETDALILATGARANLLGLDAEQKLMGHGVSTCATCDGAFFRDKHVLVVGGGDSAMEESTFLTRFCERVTIVHRRDELRASEIMAERAKKNDKIDFLWSHVVVDILGEPESGVEAVKVKDVKTDETRDVECDGLFLAIGHTPNTDLVKGQVELDEKGYVVVEPGGTVTEVEGFFAAGDCFDSRYRQAVTAAGMGCKAALDAQRFLEAQG
jgi:thioredoxin reductase (NADPH)